MRIIDADKLNIYDVSPADGFVVMGVTEEDIALAPNIDIIRCGECKHWMDDRKDEDDMGTCGLTHYFTNTDDFCSYGEREGE